MYTGYLYLSLSLSISLSPHWPHFSSSWPRPGGNNNNNNSNSDSKNSNNTNTNNPPALCLSNPRSRQAEAARWLNGQTGVIVAWDKGGERYEAPTRSPFEVVTAGCSLEIVILLREAPAGTHF